MKLGVLLVMGLLNGLLDEFPAVFGPDSKSTKVGRPSDDFEKQVAQLSSNGYIFEGSAVENTAPAGAPFSVIKIDLNNSEFEAGRGLSIPATGYGLIFRRYGSAPNARLRIETVGKLEGFWPGSRFRAPFQGFTVYRESERYNVSGITANAFAYLVVEHNPDATYTEPAFEGSPLIVPVNLLGNPANETQFYTGSNLMGTTDISSGVPITGWKTVRLFFKRTTPGGLIYQYDIIPLIAVQRTADLVTGGRWYLQRTKTVSFLFSNDENISATGLWFTHDFDVRGINGRFFLALEPLDGLVEMALQGIE